MLLIDSKQIRDYSMPLSAIGVTLISVIISLHLNNRDLFVRLMSDNKQLIVNSDVCRLKRVPINCESRVRSNGMNQPWIGRIARNRGSVESVDGHRCDAVIRLSLAPVTQSLTNLIAESSDQLHERCDF